MNKPSAMLKSDKYIEPHRIPLRVTHALRFPSGYIFPICPACGITLEWEYQNYCDRCGQCLEWRYYSKATVLIWSKAYGMTRQHK